MTVNVSGIRATEFNVVVRPEKVEEVSKGGVIIPEMARDKQQAAAVEGVVVHVSPLAFTYERWPEDGDPKPKVGDRVLYAKYSGMKRTGKDGVDYIILKDKDIAAVIE